MQVLAFIVSNDAVGQDVIDPRMDHLAGPGLAKLSVVCKPQI
jgi:hypothetical protein